ncbi:MAG: serine hydrolase, partial [Myxococcales bacterium]|nr:serine hydrolase [Myxococcales bacterium]
MRKLFLLFAIAFGALLLVVVLNPQRARRAVFMATLFQGVDVTDEFADMRSLFPIRTVRTADPTPLPVAAQPAALPEHYVHEGEKRPLRRFLEETDTSGLLVLRDGEIVHEEYALGSSRETRWISWSVAKSFVSAMVGVAFHDGLIESLHDPISKYVPELAGSSYDGVEIEDILEMSSGASWDEDYGDPLSDITRFGTAIVFGRSQDDFAASLEREHPPGSYNRYNSTDTQVLGMLLVRVTGMTLAEYTERTLWQPMQMQYDAYWITDEPGMELAFGGLNVTLRDYARFGELYRNGGRWNGRQVVPEAWVAASTVPGEPHLQPRGVHRAHALAAHADAVRRVLDHRRAGHGARLRRPERDAARLR